MDIVPPKKDNKDWNSALLHPQQEYSTCLDSKTSTESVKLFLSCSVALWVPSKRRKGTENKTQLFHQIGETLYMEKCVWVLS